VSDCYLPRLGGIERQVHELAVRQREAGHEVVVVTSVAGDGSDEKDGLVVVRPGARRSASPTRMHYEWTPRGCRAVLGGGFDVVHIHASSFSPLAYVTAARCSSSGVPVAMTVHSLWAGATPLFQAADRIAKWGGWNVAWSAVSSPAADPLRRILGPRTPVAILPNGVDPPAWSVADVPRQPGRVVVATVGRLAVRKRPGPLLRMLREAQARLPRDLRLEALIVGDGPLRRPLERYVETTAIGDWVTFRGCTTHSQLRDLYADVDFYVAPATLESFGIAALEARCAGLPVVAHRDSGVSEFILDGVDGLLSRGDAEMVDSIVRLARSEVLRERMRAHARAVPPPVSWEGVLAATDALYERAVAVAAASRAGGASLALSG
jgi:glycosyltransferase involved in cell wall biosynthesis